MKTESEFKEYYRTTFLPVLEDLDAFRRKIRFRNVLTTVGFIALFAVLSLVGFIVNRMIYGVWFSEKTPNVPLIVLMIVSIILFLYFLGILHANKRKFVDRYKREIVGEIVRFLDNRLLYEANKMVAEQEFIASGLFYPMPDKYIGDDLVSGKIGKTLISFSEVHALYKTQTGGQDDTRDKWHRLFDGLFFKADFNKNFKGKLFLLPDQAEKIFGRRGVFFQSMKKRLGELVHLENVDFEKQFVVYGSDQVEARYILSSSLMKRLLDFKLRTAKEIRISFARSSVYIAIPYKKPLFEPKYYTSVIDEKKTTEYFLDLEMAIGIVEDLNLNLRIWSKE